MKHTLQETLVAGLKAIGCRQVDTRSGKYLAFRSTKHPDKHWFVGASGALRYGRNASDSISVEPMHREKILHLGRKAITEAENPPDRPLFPSEASETGKP